MPIEGNLVVLTNKRLVVSKEKEEESYPLSKITGVKVLQVKRGLVRNVGRVLCGLGFGFALVLNSNGGIIEIGLSVLMGIVGLLMIFLKDRTRLHILQMGGEKSYDVLSDPKLFAFIEMVNQRLD